jgi:hypothetical protein
LDRPAHCFRDLIGNTQCQRANVFRLDRECERPLLPKRMELLAVFLRAAIAFGFRHSRTLSVNIVAASREEPDGVTVASDL